MSWSLRLHNGDLALSGASLATVTDEQKLVQDLRCALLEHMGTDDMHPDYGSLLDGGIKPDGTVVQSVIGVANPRQAGARVHAEIQRLASAYQAQQLNRAKSDRLTYNRVSLTPGEVLLSISNIAMTQVQDVLAVTVALSTATGQDINFVLPVTTN